MAEPGYSPRPLFGGAMKVLIPEEFQDISAIYPVPDNQEIFKSTRTKTNIIIEIVERLEPGSYTLPTEALASASALASVQDSSTSLAAADSTNNPIPSLLEDHNAVLYHIHDVCNSNGDSYEILDPPKPYPVQLIPKPTYTCQALISTMAKAPPGASTTSTSTSPPTVSDNTAAASSSSPQGPLVIEATSTCHFFLVRLEEYGTDILVHINVPHDTLEQSGVPGAVAQEEMHAHGIMAQMMRSLEIKDHSLFGDGSG